MSEMDHEMEEMREDEDDMDEMREDEHDMEEGGMREDEHEMEEDMEDEMTEMDDEMEMEGHHEGHDEMREDEHEMDEMRGDTDEAMHEEDDLELEAIIKELEDEIEEDEHELEESNDASSGIGASDNKQPAPAANADSTDDPEGTGAKVVAESEDGMEGESETLDNLHEEEDDHMDEGMREDEDIDLEEVIRSLREEEEELEESEDGMEGESETINNLTEKLKESYSVVKFLRSKINEVNLLNAKLLFTNKLFRNGNLNESQKLKVIETFDRAKSTREVKLVYTTLAESTMATRSTRRGAIKEGFASKAVASTKPRKAIISEGADMASRFKKLAGLTK
jgi:hypothetical protein